MPFNVLKRVLACALICVLLCGLCACTPYVDQEFINANLNVTTQPTTQPESNSTLPTLPPETESTETKPKPDKKPGGFILNDPTEPAVTEPETESGAEQETRPNENPIPPIVTPTPGGTTVKVSNGMKTALNHLGKTVANKITVFSPIAGSDGGYAIIFIKNSAEQAERFAYSYYETKDEYQRAKQSADTSMCNDELRLIANSSSTTLPVTDPETMSIVLFDGYIIWR